MTKKRSERQRNLRRQRAENRKRDQFEEDEKNWKIRVRDLELEAKSCEETIKIQENLMKECIQRALGTKHQSSIKSALETADFACQKVSESTTKLMETQKKLQRLMSKKPKEA